MCSLTTLFVVATLVVAAFVVSKSQQRTKPIWCRYYILEAISFASVLTNCAIIAWTSTILRDTLADVFGTSNSLELTIFGPFPFFFFLFFVSPRHHCPCTIR